jgi:hypothetical protein
MDRPDFRTIEEVKVVRKVTNCNLLIVCLAVFCTYIGGCNKSSMLQTPPATSVSVTAPSSKPIKDVYSIEDLLRNRRSFAHTMVKVSGCFWSDAGSVFDNAENLLKQCGSRWKTSKDLRDHIISIEDADFMDSMNQLRLHEKDPDALERLKLFRIPELLFDYDKRRNSQTWRKLPKGLGLVSLLDDDGPEVVLLGQFETDSWGHGHPNELILVDVLNKPNTTP